MLEVGEIEGKKIYYDSNSKKFTVTLDVGGAKQVFRSTSEIALRKKVSEAVKKPPIDAIEVHWWGISRPTLSKVVISGERLYKLQESGKKMRVEPSNFRRFDEEKYQKLMELFKQHEVLEGKFKQLRESIPLILKEE